MNRRTIFGIAAAALMLVGCESQPGSEFNDSASSLASTSASADTYEPIAPQTFSGNGDDVVSLGDLTGGAVLTFDCPACDGNTTVKTDGSEGLLVNTIGAYSGSHFINLRDNSMTTQVVVGADAAWTMTVEDLTTAPDETSGSGDAALILHESGTQATITNRGEGNFVVWVYSLSGSSDLAVNEIGSYHGTVPFDAPAIVQVESDGTWNIDLS